MDNQDVISVVTEENGKTLIEFGKVANAQNAKVYVSEKVVLRVYDLLLTQQEFYKHRDKKTLEECKRREVGFINWVRSNLIIT